MAPAAERRRASSRAALAMRLAALWPLAPLLDRTRRLCDIQLTTRELARVARCVRARRPCRFLVFGVGNDSALWRRLNRGGRTVFLEDDDAWLLRARVAAPGIEAHRVVYETRLRQWRELLDAPERLRLPLPSGVAEGSWDVVLVDGPRGWEDVHPGRMQSVYAAARLAASGGHVFVHDCDRPVERAYAERYLSAANLVAEVEKLREYRRDG